MQQIPFNRPFMVGKELEYISQAHDRAQIAGDGEFTYRCQKWLEDTLGCRRALLTHSCTAALEMSALLCGVGEGDEVIMPAFTFVSTANAFVLRGAKPVFVDVRRDTLNMDENLVEQAITERTKVVLPVHYAGVGCEMAAIRSICERNDLLLVEDAAQGLMSSYKGEPLGTLGQLGTLSFHETKNIVSGEGGALLINDDEYAARAEIIREKGTNRSQFFRGEVDKYTWVDIGSSYLPGEIIAAFLWAQIEQASVITDRRRALWENYHQAFEGLERSGRLIRPTVPEGIEHNAHIYYLMLESEADRSDFISRMKADGIHCVFHYVPLHDAPFGRRVSRSSGTLDVTQDIAGRLVRLPMWIGLEEFQQRVIDKAVEHLTR